MQSDGNIDRAVIDEQVMITLLQIVKQHKAHVLHDCSDTWRHVHSAFVETPMIMYFDLDCCPMKELKKRYSTLKELVKMKFETSAPDGTASLVESEMHDLINDERKHQVAYRTSIKRPFVDDDQCDNSSIAPVASSTLASYATASDRVRASPQSATSGSAPVVSLGHEINEMSDEVVDVYAQCHQRMKYVRLEGGRHKRVLTRK